jgi:hypothetical protein
MMEKVTPIFLELFCVFNSVQHFYSILCLFGPALSNLCTNSLHIPDWLALWFPALDCSNLQCKYAKKNFSLFSGKPKWCVLCNCLRPTDLTPLLCLLWASQSDVRSATACDRLTWRPCCASRGQAKQSNSNQYSAQPYMLAIRLYSQRHLKISKLLSASGLNWELSNVSFHSTEKEIEISKTHWF